MFQVLFALLALLALLALTSTDAQRTLLAENQLPFATLAAAGVFGQSLVAAASVFGQNLVAAAAELKLGLAELKLGLMDLADHLPSHEPRERGMPVRCTVEEFERTGNIYRVFPDGTRR
ncbi:hypothetical protein HYH03_002912 [Edaphochlamys debaryana]|uniref:Uncharacterized protein n=1 Tax=Edaphochlamys debaryana TaxID=47281 RepID=A0A835YB20_9CHLO|nr:hypothetical protein HYH03_002912 [Edaphochlamys debaryana]|eukprot:KAG2499336.1 hypothetical protein HYH03_002912 [Edaphochlamys debaryana]